jgi:hypothetical protein
VGRVLDAMMNDLNDLTRLLVGPQSVVPWWGWTAWLLCIFGGLLAPGIQAMRPAVKGTARDELDRVQAEYDRAMR